MDNSCLKSNKEDVFTLRFRDLEQFYSECDIVESTGSKQMYNNHCKEDDYTFRGLHLDKIKESKYSYREGLDNLKPIEDLFLGGQTHKYKWDEIDGDDMNYDRFIDQLPCLKKRTYIEGTKQGKIINLHVGIAENCNIDYQCMLTKAYFVMQVIDTLESLGYRIGVTAYMYAERVGRYKGTEMYRTLIEVPIKKPEEPLIKGLILTCISPWMFRYHFFKMMMAKFDCNQSLGHSIRYEENSTKSDIYIDSGQCLTKESCRQKILYLKQLFDSDFTE